MSDTATTGPARADGSPEPSARDVARGYFPDLNDHDLDTVIWSETSFPSFWNIPDDGETPLACFRHQLAQAAFRRRRQEGLA